MKTAMSVKTIILATVLAGGAALLGCKGHAPRIDEKDAGDNDYVIEPLKVLGYPVIDTDDYCARADSALLAEPGPENYLWKATALDLKGSHEEAMSYTDKVLEMCKDDRKIMSRAHRLRATIYLQMGNTKKEREEYQKIIDLGCKDLVEESKEAMARSYFHEGLYQEALVALPDSLSDEGKVYYRLITDSLVRGK